MAINFHALYKLEAAKKAPWLHDDKAAGVDIKVFHKDQTKMKARTEKHKADMTAWVSELEAEVKALEAKASPGVLAAVNTNAAPLCNREDCSDTAWSMAMHRRREVLKASIGAGPAPAPKPAAQAPAPVATPQGVGKTVVALATHPNPEVRGPILEGLQASLAARLGLTEERFITRAEFETLSHKQRSEYCRNGGRLRDPEPAPVPPLAPGAKVATLAQFHTIPHAKRGEFFKNGGKLID